MATIEPRLIHLLNDPTPANLPPAPPPSLFTVPPNLPVGLPPIEGAGAAPQPEIDLAENSHLAGASLSHRVKTFSDVVVDHNPFPREKSQHAADEVSRRTGPSIVPRSRGAHSLQMLLSKSDPKDQALPLSRILDDKTASLDDAATKKRLRVLTTKDDLVPLPQPLKKQRSAKLAVPPIINGLYEPPPNASLFPPISSSSFDGSDRLGIRSLRNNFNPLDKRPSSTAVETAADEAQAVTKVKKRAAKPRRKWSEEETNHLLLGVSRHGVGKWTTILEDTDFKFNDRSAGDLKDRFRTCCPDELRGHMGRPRSGRRAGAARAPPDIEETRPAWMQAVLVDENKPADSRDPPANEESLSSNAPPVDNNEVDAKPKKSRAHRKKMEDLAELGIHGPFKQSHRRQRRPFTDQDDKAILQGLEVYGAAWSKIQRDPRFNLSSRLPTDLRDRVRNKYPEVFTRIEKGNITAQTSEPSRAEKSLLEPAVTTSIESSMHATKTGPDPLEPDLSLSQSGSREDLPRWAIGSSLLESTTDAFLRPTSFHQDNKGEAFPSNGVVDEMGISRLLLEDFHVSNGGDMAKSSQRSLPSSGGTVEWTVS